MAFVFQRQLAIPLWAMAFFAVALTASPPSTPLLIAALGIVIVLTTAGSIPWLRASRSVAHVGSQRWRTRRSAAIPMNRRACVRTFDGTDMTSAEDALDLVRMDDDGWYMAQRVGVDS